MRAWTMRTWQLLDKQLVVLLHSQFLAACGTLVLSLNGVPDTHVAEDVSTHSSHQATARTFKLLCSVHTDWACEGGLSWRGLEFRWGVGGRFRGLSRGVLWFLSCRFGQRAARTWSDWMNTAVPTVQPAGELRTGCTTTLSSLQLWTLNLAMVTYLAGELMICTSSSDSCTITISVPPLRDLLVKYSWSKIFKHNTHQSLQTSS